MKEYSHAILNSSIRLRRVESFSFLFVIPFIIYSSITLVNHQKHILELQKAILSSSENQYERSIEIEESFVATEMEFKPVTVENMALQKTSKHIKCKKRDSFLSLVSSNYYERQKVPSYSTKKQKIRRLEDINKNVSPLDTPSDCINLTISIELDQYPTETMWNLIDDNGQVVIANYTYSDDEAFEKYSYSFCLAPSQFLLNIYDSYGDGLLCESIAVNGNACYSYMVNGKEMEGSTFSEIKHHEIDMTRHCIFGPMLLLKLHFHSIDTEISLILLNTYTKNTEYNFIQTTEPKLHENSTETYYLCMEPGMYEISIGGVNSTGNLSTCKNSCYDLSIEDNPTIYGPRKLDGIALSFYVNSEWFAKERMCHQQPILTAINDFSRYSFDNRVFQILHVLQAISSLENIVSPEKAQYKAACFVLYDDTNNVAAEDPFLRQRYTLALFLFATNEAPELELPKNPCLSDEYSCNELNEITRIDWSKRGTGGTIPTEIGHFTKLENLNLVEKHLEGTIPTEITKLKNLHTIRLFTNDLTGYLPSTIGLMRSLEILLLNENNLSGTIPNEIGNLSRLKFLSLRKNQFKGTIPSEIFSNQELEAFDCANNKLTGTIPSEIGQPDIMWLFYSENNLLTGSIPSELGQMTHIQDFDASHNLISGTIPKEMNEWNWWNIFLHNNKLTGSIPPLTVLNRLYLSQNKLTGDIPDEIWNPNITGVRLRDNEVRGAVSDLFCANLAFADGFEEESIYDLAVDNSRWFIDQPMVTCPCCDDNICHLWEYHDQIIVGGTRKPSCPNTNLFSVSIFFRYVLHDIISDVYIARNVGFGVEEKIDFCLSPTGCYEMKMNKNDGFNADTLSFDKTFRLGYSAAARGLAEFDHECDAVDICGTLFEADDPKRMGLNHLTHIAFEDLALLDDPSSGEYKAMCWIMTQDELYHEFDICDGTLLQRYVIVLFYFTMKDSMDTIELLSKHTCDWQGVTCDPSRTFVEGVELPDMNLQGTLITEIGLLTRLRKLDLGQNELSGTIDISLIKYLPHLEVFDVSKNKLRGTISDNLVTLPSLKKLNVSNNLIVGSLPFGVRYAGDLESFDTENNLLTGFIPHELIACSELVEINLSQNNFKGTIPTAIGALQSLNVLKLDQNSLTGSLPSEIFYARNIETFQLQSNLLTGSIPDAVGNLDRANLIAMNHNSLKGSIPRAFEDMSNLEWLQLHRNHLTGQAPYLPRMTKFGENERYMTDCGEPSFELPNKLICETCTTCCNSEQWCQANRKWSFPIVGVAFVLMITIPIASGLLLYFFNRFCHDSKNPLDIYDENTTYCLFFADTKLAWLMYSTPFIIQGCFYYVFLLASSFESEYSEWQFTIRCPGTKTFCEDENEVAMVGWILFYCISFPSLGNDFMYSFFQIRKASYYVSPRLYFSGFLNLGMTAMAIFTSVYYNLALATSNGELVVNALILLFVNGLDEEFMRILKIMAPEWVELRMEEVRDNVTRMVHGYGSNCHDEEKSVTQVEIQPVQVVTELDELVIVAENDFDVEIVKSVHTAVHNHNSRLFNNENMCIGENMINSL